MPPGVADRQRPQCRDTFWSVDREPRRFPDTIWPATRPLMLTDLLAAWSTADPVLTCRRADLRAACPQHCWVWSGAHRFGCV